MAKDKGLFKTGKIAESVLGTAEDLDDFIYTYLL